MTPRLQFVCLAVLGTMMVATALGQTTGDYRSAQTGNWHDASSWEEYNGSSWVAAVTAPVTADGAVNILNGHTITLAATDSIDQLTIEAGGKLVIDAGDTLNIEDGTGTDLTVSDSLVNMGTITLDTLATVSFESGSVYKHDEDGGDIPTATWVAGSTCLITGATGHAPGNANQDFYNFTWDCPAQSSNLNVAWDNNTIGGDLTCVTTNGKHFRMTSSTYSGTTITINGNVILMDGVLTSTGSSGAATYNIVILGDLDVTGGTLGPSRGSGGNATWFLKGDVSIANATIQSSNADSRFFFSKRDTQYVLFNNVSTTGTFQVEIDSSTTVILQDGPDSIDCSVVDSLINRGEIAGPGTLQFPDGSIYVHPQNGGTIPIALWETGSTCEVTGATSSAPANRAQNFYNFTWNCPAQSANLNMGWQNGTTIGGTLTVTSSNWDHASTTSPSRQFRLFGGAGSCTINNIVVNGYDAVLTPQGSGYADTVNVLGNITVSNGGLLSLSNSGSGVTQYYVHGNFTVVDSAYIGKSSSSNLSRFIFAAQGAQSFTTPPTGVTYFNGPNFDVVSGSVLDLGTSVVGSTGSFRVDSAAAIQTGHPDGFDGNIACTGANGGGNAFSKSASYGFNGIVPQMVGTFLPDTVAGLTFSNAAGVALNDTVYSGTLSVSSGTTLQIDSAGNLTANAGTVAGTVADSGAFAGTASLTFADGSMYTRLSDGGSVPTATWASGSTCEVTGTVSSPPSNLNQDFYNFVWNTPGLGSNKDWGWANNTIGGDVTVSNTGSARIRMTSPDATPLGPNTITIMGDILVDGGSFESNGSSSQDTITINSHGNITVTTTGVFAVSRGSGPYVTWNVYGDFSMTNAEARNSGGDKATFAFTKDGVQKLSLSSVTFGGGGLPIVVDSGATLQLDSSVVAGSGRFIVMNGGGLVTTHPLGLNGNLTMIDTLVSLSSGADYTFKGSAAQVTGNLLPATVRTLAINNAAGVTLSDTVAVDGLVLTAGKFTLGTSEVAVDSVSGGSATSYVETNGSGGLTINAVGSTETMFPVGSTSFAPVWITNKGTADAFRASVGPDPAAAPFGGRVHQRWEIAEGTPGGSMSTLKLGWMASAEDTAFANNRAANAMIYLLATDTTEAGLGSYTTQFSTEPYSVSRDSVSSFGAMVVGKFVSVPSSVEPTDGIPTVFRVSQNYPNPFNPSTSIQYDIPQLTQVSVRIYDVLGRQVAELVNKEQAPGSYTIQWNAASFTSGVYYCSVKAGDAVKIVKLMLVK